MKRYSNIYPKIYDFENLYQAYLFARKRKTQRDEVLKFSANLEAELIELQNELIWKTYRVSRYREFYVLDPKKRLIMALPFRDRVVQWAIYRQVNHLLDQRYISTSYACRDEMGTQKAVRKLQQFIRHTNGEAYVLKLDISKYFYRINHSKLLSLLAGIFKDDDLLDLFGKIIESDKEHNPFGINLESGMRENGVGMPIGNLTSQMFANLYLNEVDQFAKHSLHVKYYIRYMDDIAIIGSDKNELRRIWHAIEAFVETELDLRLNGKSAIEKAKVGVDFCGYRVWRDHILFRKKAALRMKRRLRYVLRGFGKGEMTLAGVQATVQSYIGLLSHCDGYKLSQSICDNYERMTGHEVFYTEKDYSHCCDFACGGYKCQPCICKPT